MTKLGHVTQRIDDAVVHVCTLACVALLAGIVVVVFAGVIWRYVLHDPLSFQEEASQLFVVWMTYLGGPVAMRHGTHVALDWLNGLLSRRLACVARILSDLLMGVILAIFIYYGSLAAYRATGQISIMLGGMSMVWFYAAVPLGSALFLFAVIVDIGRTAAEMMGGAASDHEYHYPE